MVNKRIKSARMLSLIGKRTREADLTLTELQGRGKGSHRIFIITDADDHEVARFGLTGHDRELSWTVLRQIEDGLAHLFGERWTER